MTTARPSQHQRLRRFGLAVALLLAATTSPADAPAAPARVPVSRVDIGGHGVSAGIARHIPLPPPQGVADGGAPFILCIPCDGLA